MNFDEQANQEEKEATYEREGQPGHENDGCWSCGPQNQDEPLGSRQLALQIIET